MRGNESVVQQIADRLYIAGSQADVGSAVPNAHEFRTPKIKYHAYCDDFGPMNATSIIEFIMKLDDQLILHKKKNVVYISDPGVRAFTNATFLVGCYLILKKDFAAEQCSEIFAGIDPDNFEEYRDATFSENSFRLSLLDCWDGLVKAKSHGWIGMPDRNGLWGSIDPAEYLHYEHPLNGNIHISVPGKFVAFQGPHDLADGRMYLDTQGKGRRFSPRYYLDIFKALKVTCVVRLTEPEYDREIFENAGLPVHELEFEDCSTPPVEIVQQFLQICDVSPGLVAVHCKAGLGRTGTLIALYLMRHHGFTARAAMGWLRIMRPGSVIGAQQSYLCEVEQHMLAMTPAALCPSRKESLLPPRSLPRRSREPSPNPASTLPGLLKLTRSSSHDEANLTRSSSSSERSPPRCSSDDPSLARFIPNDAVLTRSSSHPEAGPTRRSFHEESTFTRHAHHRALHIVGRRSLGEPHPAMAAAAGGADGAHPACSGAGDGGRRAAGRWSPGESSEGAETCGDGSGHPVAGDVDGASEGGGGGGGGPSKLSGLIRSLSGGLNWAFRSLPAKVDTDGPAFSHSLPALASAPAPAPGSPTSASAATTPKAGRRPVMPWMAAGERAADEGPGPEAAGPAPRRPPTTAAAAAAAGLRRSAADARDVSAGLARMAAARSCEDFSARDWASRVAGHPRG